MKHTFKKIATNAAIAASLAVAAQASFSQDYQQNTPGISGTDIIKNVGIGAAAGAILGKITNGNATNGAAIGAVLGIGKSIYDDIQIKNEAEKETAKQPSVNHGYNGNPIKQVSTVPFQDVQNNQVVYDVNAAVPKATVVKTMHTALMSRADGKTPAPVMTRLKDGTMELQGQSVQDIVYGLGSVLQTKHKVRLDIVSTEAASLRQQSVIKERNSIKFNPDNFLSTMNALHKVAKEMDMGIVYEDKTNYALLASKQMARYLVSNPDLQHVAQSSGITSEDVDEVLKNYRPQAKVQTSSQFTMTNQNYQDAALYSYSEISKREQQHRFRP